MRAAAVAAALIILVTLLWVGGELHRRNCIDSGKQACTVLPWNAGTRHHHDRRVQHPIDLNEPGSIPLG